MKIYAVSDIHGCADAFYNALDKIDLSCDNKLILLGDYIHGGTDNFEVLDAIIHLQESYGKEKVIALLGNHEALVLDHRVSINNEIYNEYFFENCHDEEEDKYIEWLKELPLYHVEGNTIFVHAGVDEEAGELWEIGTADYIFTDKFPAQLGKFEGGMSIVAGHISAATISGDKNYHEILWDGESHLYIDGCVLKSGVIPVLMLDTDTGKYYQIKENGAEIILPYDLPDKVSPYGDEY